MAKLYISEYQSRGVVSGSTVEVAREPSVDQVVTFSTETKSAAFASTTHLVRLHADAKCSVKFGASPTATTNSKKLAADSTEYFAVEPGHKVSVIANNT